MTSSDICAKRAEGNREYETKQEISRNSEKGRQGFSETKRRARAAERESDGKGENGKGENGRERRWRRERERESECGESSVILPGNNSNLPFEALDPHWLVILNQDHCAQARIVDNFRGLALKAFGPARSPPTLLPPSPSSTPPQLPQPPCPHVKYWPHRIIDCFTFKPIRLWLMVFGKLLCWVHAWTVRLLCPGLETFVVTLNQWRVTQQGLSTQGWQKWRKGLENMCRVARRGECSVCFIFHSSEWHLPWTAWKLKSEFLSEGFDMEYSDSNLLQHKQEF